MATAVTAPAARGIHRLWLVPSFLCLALGPTLPRMTTCYVQLWRHYTLDDKAPSLSCFPPFAISRPSINLYEYTPHRGCT